MLLRHDLKVWSIVDHVGAPVEYVVASDSEEAASIVYEVMGLENFSLTRVDPISGEKV